MPTSAMTYLEIKFILSSYKKKQTLDIRIELMTASKDDESTKYSQSSCDADEHNDVFGNRIYIVEL